MAPRKGLSPKLQQLWTGPHRVLEHIGEINYSIEGPDSTRRLVPITRLKPFHARDEPAARSAPVSTVPMIAAPDTSPRQPATAPLPLLPPGFFHIDKLIERRPLKPRGFQYLVRWQGFTAADDTWEPRSNIPRSVVGAFDREHPFRE